MPMKILLLGLTVSHLRNSLLKNLKVTDMRQGIIVLVSVVGVSVTSPVFLDWSFIVILTPPERFSITSQKFSLPHSYPIHLTTSFSVTWSSCNLGAKHALKATGGSGHKKLIEKT